MDTAKAEITRLLSGDELTKSDVINLMSQLRICLETDNLRRQYPYLTMYCDWTVHPQLSRSALAFQVIESIADAIINNPNAPNTLAFFDDITKAFLFEELRTDCIKVSTHYGTPGKFCTNNDIWNAFLEFLISILIERPLAFPESTILPKNVAPIYNRIQRKWILAFKNTIGIKKVSFVLGTGEHEGKVLWNVELIPGLTCIPKSATLRGPLKKL